MLSDKIFKISFAISLTVHLFLLVLLEFILNFPLSKNSMWVVTEVERITITPKTNLTKQYNSKRLKDVSYKLKKQSNETITTPSTNESQTNLDAQHANFSNSNLSTIISDYLYLIREKIEKNKEYPFIAKIKNIEGTVKVTFSIQPNGEISEIKIIESSGYEILDEAAVLAIKRCNPFPPLPEELKISDLKIKVDIIYNLK